MSFPLTPNLKFKKRTNFNYLKTFLLVMESLRIQNLRRVSKTVLLYRLTFRYLREDADEYTEEQMLFI